MMRWYERICISRDTGLKFGKMSVWLFWKFLKSAILNDLTLVQDDNSAALLNCWHAVGNNYWSAAFHGTVESLLDDLLTLFV